MNNYDDLFNSNDENTDNNKKTPYDKDAWIEKKKQERAEAYELLDTATEEVAKLVEAVVGGTSVNGIDKELEGKIKTAIAEGKTVND